MEVTEHPNCPRCAAQGDEETEGELHILIRKQVENKVLPAKTMPATEIHIHVNLSVSLPPIVGGRIPAIREFRDICEKCGTIWAFRIEHGHVTYTGDVRQPVKDFV